MRGMHRVPRSTCGSRCTGGVKPLRIDRFNPFSANRDAAVACWGEMGFRATEVAADAVTGRTWAAWMQRKGCRA